MNISFAYTTQALLQGKKTVTRRCWDDNYAKRFKKGDIVLAYNRQPRFRGKPIARIRITKDPYRQPLHFITAEDLKKEGGMWVDKEDFWELFPCSEPYVIEFELIEIKEEK
jgi:hypothetical protein